MGLKKSEKNNCFYFLSKKSHIPTFSFTQTSKLLTFSKIYLLNLPLKFFLYPYINPRSYTLDIYSRYCVFIILSFSFSFRQLSKTTNSAMTPCCKLQIQVQQATTIIVPHQIFQEHKTPDSQNNENKFDK